MYRASISRKLDGVIDEVGEDTFGRTGVEDRARGSALHLKLHVACGGDGAKTLFDGVEHGSQLERARSKLRRLGCTELEEARNQLFQRLDFLETVRDELALRPRFAELSQL